MSFVPISELPECDVECLWSGRLPAGHTTMVDGDPGIGKSLLTLDLCARVTTGQTLPDGAANATPPSHVIIINAEDRARNVIRPRLAAAGADLKRVVVWNRDPGEPWLRLPSQVRDLDEALKRTSARLVVLDPILAFLDAKVNLGSDVSVRAALSPLSDLAEKHRCAMLLVRHLNKSPGGPALYRGLYSIAFTAACRMAWLIGRDPRVPKQYVLTQPKNNLDAPQPSLAYKIVTHSSGQAKIEWLGQSVWTDQDVVRSVGAGQSKKMRVVEFLMNLLEDGPKTTTVIWQAALEHGFSKRTLQRAKQHLRIRHQQIGSPQNQQHFWLLPNQKLPEEILRASDTYEVDVWLERLREQYPARPPLEEDRTD